MAIRKKAVAKKAAPAPKTSKPPLPRIPRESIKISSGVKVTPPKNYNGINEKLASGADKAKADNARSIAKSAANKKALKAANTPKLKRVPNRGGGRMRISGGGGLRIDDMNR